MKAAALALLSASLLTLSACTPQSSHATGNIEPCPTSPNCVSSDATDKNHFILPFQLTTSAEKAWPIVIEVIMALPRSNIIQQTDDFLDVECRSAVFGFVDDLKLQLRVSEGLIAVYSASRIGYSDFGVNRDRIEVLRAALIKRGVIK
ncbi:hypothetical protein DUF1499 [Psychromonas ingrahamii 37]|uniref:DUF1499 domain-containing protein n=1 Tax=Psychromonas ingrahamii (strain DSM 17664 / CCUG 51855 / 37) TaxID=357804 RepID=A1SVR1_PSYIN|nr:DUF1499 domain-containing protein [Psychromonas ingrahamii]ABM03576.1 hypothetical protein DUF1499 [Psychromonas ingrahamii 37]